MGIWDLRGRAKEILNHKMDSLNFLVLFLTIIGLYVVFWIVAIIMFILGYSVSSVLDNKGLELILVLFFTLGIFFLLMLTPMYNIFATHMSVLSASGKEGHILKHLRFDDVVNYIVIAFKTTCVTLSAYLVSLFVVGSFLITTKNLDIETAIESTFFIIFFIVLPFMLIFWLFYLKFIFTYQILLIEDCGFFRACINSWKLTNKCYGKVLLMELSFIPWYLVSYIPIIGNFVVWCYVIPYKRITYTILYHDLMNGYMMQDNTVTADWVSNQDARYDSMFSQQPIINLNKNEVKDSQSDIEVKGSSESEVIKLAKDLEKTLDNIMNGNYIEGE